MNINSNSVFNNINQDTLVWKAVGDIKENQKIETKKDEKVKTASTGEDKFPSAQFVKKNLDSVASEESPIKWIEGSKIKTREHLDQLTAVILKHGVQPQVLSSSQEALRELKSTIEHADQGLENLKVTYQGQVTKEGKSIPDLLAKEQKALNQELLKEISALIILVGEKLQPQPEPPSLEAIAIASIRRELQATTAERDILVPGAFAILADESQSHIPAPPPTLAEWKTGLVQQYYTPPIENKDGVRIARELVQGKQNYIQLVDVGGAQMPDQFGRDLIRFKKFTVQGETFSHRTIQQNPATPYERLCNLFKSDGALIGQRVASMISQSYLSDISIQVMAEINKDPSQFTNAQDKKQDYAVEVIGDKVKITIKVSFDIYTIDSDSKIQNKGAVIVKREIEIPIEDLRDPELITSKNPLPNAKVMDTYSKRIESPAHADELFDVF